MTQHLPTTHTDGTGLTGKIETEVLRHMRASPTAVLGSTAGRLLSVDSAPQTERLVREFNIWFIGEQKSPRVLRQGHALHQLSLSLQLGVSANKQTQ